MGSGFPAKLQNRMPRRPLAFFAGRPQGHSSLTRDSAPYGRAIPPRSPRGRTTSLTKGFRGAAKGRLRYPFSLAAGPWQKVEERKSALRGRRPLALFRRPALTKASFRRAVQQKTPQLSLRRLFLSFHLLR